MKTIRGIVALRLALFPLIFNLNFAQEIEMETDESSSRTTLSVANGEVEDPGDTPMDSSAVPQNDNNTQENETSMDSRLNAQNDNLQPIIFSIDTTEGQVEEKPPFDKGDVEGNDAKGFNTGDTQEIHPTPLIKGSNPKDGGIIHPSEIWKVSKGQPELYESETIEMPSLKITEVYRLGTTEWIEITNLSDEEFDGTLTFSGANNKGNILYSDINIQGYESIIVSSSENIGMITGEIFSTYSKNLSITDGNAISISLLISGNVIDTFNVDESTVTGNKNKNPRPSFQKIYNDGREIQATTTGDIYNITGFVANPGKVIVKNGNPWIGDGPLNSGDSGNTDEPGNGENPGTGDQTGTGNNAGTGDTTLENSDFNLLISEVYYDDEDEWIEIFNIGNGDFFGDLTLSGNIFSDNKTNYTYQNVQIPANDFWIIADSDEMFQNINVQLNGPDYPEFSISDEEEINISLLISGEEIDSFYIHKNRVKNIDDDRVSFQKAIIENGFISTIFLLLSKNDRKNLVGGMGIVATPGMLIWAEEENKDCTKDPNKIEYIEDETEEINCIHNSPITISEIFRGGSRYDPFIEFSIHEDIQRDYNSLLLSGSLLTKSLIIDLDDETEIYDREKLQKNTKLILTTKPGDLTEAGLITIVLHPDLSFNSFSGELELCGIVGQSRQVLDIVKITTGSLEKSNYHIGYVHACGDNMDNVMDFSPGFDESALKYFSVTSSYNEKIVETVKYVGGGGGCSCPSKEQLCGNNTGNVVQTGSLVSSGTNVKDPSDTPMDSSANASEGQTGSVEILSPSDSSFQKGTQIKIIALEPKSPESITLQSFLPYDIDLKNHNYYLKTSTAATKKYIDGILYANTIDTFSKSFGFLDAGACVYLYSGDIQIDSYCYSTEKEKTEKDKSDLKEESINSSDYQLSITYIDYDPEGSDAGNESITIESKSSKPLDLSKIKMKVNATNKKLSGILEPNNSITLKGSFGFPNSTKDGSDVVVILFYDNHIFSTYTYNPNKPKVEIPDGAVKVYSVIDGDTFRYRKEDGSLQSVRLLGVDAPESNTARYRTTECFGKEAKNYLTNLIKNQYVTLEFDSNSASSDAYGRMLAYVYLDGKMVNETLIAEGYAKEYTYKTAYSQQFAFKQAEENAKRTEKGLRSASTCGKSIEEEPEARGIDYEKLSIKISNIIYNPDGTDSGNEIVQLNVDNSQISSVSSIDFSDDFSLTIFPRSEYATGTTKNKKLTEFGLFDLSKPSNITLKGDFGLPNNRATCVSLNQGSYTFDTRCYNPNGPLSEDETVLSGDTLTFTPNVKIQSIIPNPSGKDSGKEEITLLWIPSEESADLLNLSPDFSLLINGKTKKKLVGNLTPNQNITIKGSFSLPNSASCVSLLYQGIELDNFCYSKASDGEKFNSNNTSVSEISAEELAIVKKIKLVKQGDKLCILYNKTKFSCKSIPNSTTEKNKKLLSMQNTYISELEKYIKSNYSMIYYNSEIKDYFNLYSSAKKAIKSGSGDFTRDEKNISITDISSLFQSEYEQDAKDYFITKIQSVLPENVSLALLQVGDEYNKKQVEKSDLGFLSYVE